MNKVIKFTEFPEIEFKLFARDLLEAIKTTIESYEQWRFECRPSSEDCVNIYIDGFKYYTKALGIRYYNDVFKAYFREFYCVYRKTIADISLTININLIYDESHRKYLTYDVVVLTNETMDYLVESKKTLLTKIFNNTIRKLYFEV